MVLWKNNLKYIRIEVQPNLIFVTLLKISCTKDNSQNVVHYKKLFESALTNLYFSSQKKRKKYNAINSIFSSNTYILLVVFITIYSCIQENWQSSMWYGESNTFLLSCSYIVEMLYLWYIMWFIIKNAGQITTQVSCEWKLFEMCMIRWYIAFGSYYVVFDWPVTFVYKTKIKDYYYFVCFFFSIKETPINIEFNSFYWYFVLNICWQIGEWVDWICTDVILMHLFIH